MIRKAISVVFTSCVSIADAVVLAVLFVVTPNGIYGAILFGFLSAIWLFTSKVIEGLTSLETSLAEVEERELEL